ncbi:MAG: hypothetical protein ACI39W_10785 [Brotaphodocola sp.]
MNYFKKLKQNFNKDIATLKTLTFRQKLVFIKDYYKGEAFALICLCFLTFYIGDAWVTAHRETVLEGFFTNDDENLFPAKTIADDFSKYLQLEKNQQLLFDDSLYIVIGSKNLYQTSSQSRILAYVSAKDLDFLVTTEELTPYYSEHFSIYDLNELLPEDLRQKLQDDFFYGKDNSGTTKACAVSMERSRFAQGKMSEDAAPHYLMAFSYTEHPDALIQFLEYAFAVD